ncbi:hypothetical protein ACFV4K_13885 [Nocardia sp. NPDC059764]|uniref:hypothetical protein n=1 Tax=Nocardia sp. NPDC059764 TaxID=3346939 RepID=UPI00365AAC5A
MAPSRSQPVPSWRPGDLVLPGRVPGRTGGGDVFNFNNVGDVHTAQRIARINQGNRMKESARARVKTA